MLCDHPSSVIAGRVDPVTGDAIPSGKHDRSTARDSELLCGETGCSGRRGAKRQGFTRMNDDTTENRGRDVAIRRPTMDTSVPLQALVPRNMDEGCPAGEYHVAGEACAEASSGRPRVVPAHK